MRHAELQFLADPTAGAMVAGTGNMQKLCVVGVAKSDEAELR